MSVGAKIIKFGDACSLDRIHNKGAVLPYVGLEDIVSGEGRFTGSVKPKKVQSSTFRFTSEHILYGRLRPYLNKVYLPDFDGHCSTEIFPIRPASNVDRRYLYYWLSMEATVKEIDRTCTGARMPRANMDEILEFPIPLPPLSEQQRIVAVLDEAFARLATATANADKNLKNAGELFDSYLSSAFQDSCGKWTTRYLGDESLLKIIDGDRGANYPKRTDFSNSGYCLFLNTKNVRPDGFNFSDTMFVSEKKDRELSKGKLTRNDVVLTTRGTIGNVAVYDDTVPFENIRINSGMLIFRPHAQKILPRYLFEIFRSRIMKSQISKHVSGAAQPQLPIKTLVKFGIPVPDCLDEQRKLVDDLASLADETLQLQSQYKQKRRNLVELKQSILQKAFSGELTSPPSKAVKEAAE